MIVSLLFAAVSLQAKAPVSVVPEPVRIAREIQSTIDRDGGQPLEAAWRARLTASPHAPGALFAVATFERARYRYERADSLYRRLGARADSIGRIWRAAAQLGMGAWRALGSEPARADSLYSAALVTARAANAPSIEAEVLLGLAQLRGRTRGPKEGQALLLQWWTVLPDRTPQDSAQRLCLSGALDEQLGDTAGVRHIARGAESAERLRAWRVAGSCRLAEAQSLERRGYIRGASAAASSALDHFARIKYQPGTALASQWYGYVQVQNSRFAQARVLLEQAIVSARATRFESVEAWAHSGLANLHLLLGDIGQARQHAAIAAASHVQRGDRWGVAVARGFEADALAASGELEAAAQRYAATQAAFVAAGLPRNALPALASRARLQLRLGQLDSAERTMNAAATVGSATEGWRYDAAVLRARLAMRRGQLGLADSLLHGEELSTLSRTAVDRLSAFNVALFRTQLALRRDKMASAESTLLSVTATLARWRGEQRNRDITASLAQLNNNWGGLSEVAPDLVASLSARGRLDLAFEFTEQLRARDIVERTLRAVAQLSDSSSALRALRPERGAAPVVSIAELQRTLGDDEAFVSYTLGIDDIPTSAIIVTRNSAVSREMPTRAVLLPDIARFAQLAVTGTEAVASSRRLGNALLAPVLAALPQSITRLILSPDGELHRVPFDALRLPDGRFAVERVTFSTAPSATALLALRSRAGATGTRIVAFGDPSYPARPTAPANTSDALRATSDDPFRAIALTRLRHSGDEARRVARYGQRSSVWLTGDATEDVIRSTDWRDVAVLHVAAHALVNAESQAGTALALAPGRRSDGFLSTGEIALLDLRGPLVVLSACRSSGGQVLGGEGLRGLTSPLLEAGARTVVATHWSIGDRSVVPFVDRFYAAMATGARVDDALRHAKLSAIRDGVSIADWGSFAVIGDGALRVALRQPKLSPVAWLRDVTQSLRDSSGNR